MTPLQAIVTPLLQAIVIPLRAIATPLQAITAIRLQAIVIPSS